MKNEPLGPTPLEKPAKSPSINAQDLSVSLPRTSNIHFIQRKEKFSPFEKTFLRVHQQKFIIMENFIL